jgi:hypothetical protein
MTLQTPPPSFCLNTTGNQYWLYWLLEDQKEKGVRERRKEREKKKRVL